MPQAKEAERERRHRDREKETKVISMNVENLSLRLFYGLFCSMDIIVGMKEREKNPFASFSNK
jgi:hypothetical protein